jgi:hypothetical protein
MHASPADMQALRRMVVFGFEGDYKTLRHVSAVDQVSWPTL